MSLQKADLSKFDPNGAGEKNANVFGLNFTPEESNVILVPVPWEATTSYGRGAAKGPRAIFEASPQLDLFDAELADMGLPRPWEFGIFMEPMPEDVRKLNKDACKLALPIVKAGGNIGKSKSLRAGLVAVNEASLKLNNWVYDRTKKYLEAEKIVGIVGGDHSVSFGSIQAAAEKFPGLGILHFDAHADLREAYEGFEYSHASVMNNVVNRIPQVGKMVQVGIRDFCDSEYVMATTHSKIKCYFDYQLRNRSSSGESYAKICDEVVSHLPQHVYVSFDIDGLDPSLCPSTGTPVPGGLLFGQALEILAALARANKKVVAFDLNEVAPSGKPGDEWDGNVGARLLYKLCGIALLSNGARNTLPKSAGSSSGKSARSSKGAEIGEAEGVRVLVQQDAKRKASPSRKAKGKASEKAEGKASEKAEGKAKSRAKSDAKALAKLNSKSKSQSRSKLKSKSKAGPQPGTQSKNKAEAKVKS